MAYTGELFIAKNAFQVKTYNPVLIFMKKETANKLKDIGGLVGYWMVSEQQIICNNRNVLFVQ